MMGYSFIPRHGMKDLLLTNLQSQPHLEHFCPEKIFIKLPGDNLEVEVTRFNLVK
jgi:hypothetical protein